MGAAGGGVWKTADGGRALGADHRRPDRRRHDRRDRRRAVGSQRHLHGHRSADPRGNVTNGDGVYKSTDAARRGRASASRRPGSIGRIRIHPDRSEHRVRRALGNIFGPNPERGVYRTKDGGKTWEQVLKVSRGPAPSTSRWT
jgi:hypothetical protein